MQCDGMNPNLAFGLYLCVYVCVFRGEKIGMFCTSPYITGLKIDTIIEQTFLMNVKPPGILKPQSLQLHHQNLTWNPKMKVWKKMFLFSWVNC